MSNTFNKLAEKLTMEQKVAFFHVLNDHGITVEADTVLTKFFLTLQIYVAMYEKIPESIHGATTLFRNALEAAVTDFQKPVATIAQLKKEIERLARQAGMSATDAEASRTRISEELSLVDKSLENINSSVKEGAEQAASTVSERMTELLSEALKSAMPLSDLKEAGKIFSAAVKEGRQASAELRENVKTVRWARFRTIAAYSTVAVIFIILGTWGFFYSWSERRIDEWRDYYVHQISNNDRIVSELAKYKRELSLITAPDGSKQLIMEKARGWTSTTNNGVIVFK